MAKKEPEERLDQRIAREIVKLTSLIGVEATSDKDKMRAIGKLAAIGALSAIQDIRFKQYVYERIRSL